MVWKNCLRVSAWVVLLGLSAGCQTMGSVAEQADRVLANAAPSSEQELKRAWTMAAQSCERAPTAEITLADPVCVGLVMRGRELECMARRVRDEGLKNRHAAAQGLLDWENCALDIARVLTEGYYLGPREIERRLQLCDGLLEAAPTQPQLGAWSRLARLGAEASRARPAPAEQGLGGRPMTAGLLKCEVLLPRKDPPVEVAPVVTEPVVERIETPPQLDTPKVVTKPAKKKRSKPASSGKREGVETKPAKPAATEQSGSQSGGAVKDVGSRGKQT